ncbi:glycosyltransferase [Arenibacterium sp. CAU 1754]
MTLLTPTKNYFDFATTVAGSAVPQLVNGLVAVHVVVPCFNEEKRLNATTFLQHLDDHAQLRFVFVDDGSADGTLKLLTAMQKHCPDRIDVLALSRNRGKAEAVRRGLLFATQRGADLVGYWDADLATPLSAIHDFAGIACRYDDVDVVYGSRVQLLGHRINRTLARRTVSRICSSLARMAVRLPVRDTQCGAKLLRNTHHLEESLQSEFTAGWLFDVELFARLSSKVEDRSKAFYEFPLAEWTEIAGSKVSGKVILQSGFKMLKLVVESRLMRAPSNTQTLSTTAKNDKLAA